MDAQHTNKEFKKIREIMERSSTCLSLSGLGGILAGIVALISALWAYYLLYKAHAVVALQQKLLLLAAATFVAAFLSVLFFSYRRSKKIQLSFWNNPTRLLILSIAIPFIAGSFIVLWALENQLYFLLLPLSLIIYGIAIFCGSRYSTDEARYLAIAEMFLGCLSLWLPENYGLLMWAIGFGVLHIVYGAAVWNKYERKNNFYDGKESHRESE
jgi:Na+-driven multidrug efflux pump